MVELLAPAGDFSCLKSAINAGADAIYVGGSRFSARAYAGNFTDEELVAAIKYAHLFGRKLYLTVNILLKNDEMSQLYDYISPLYQAGLDGVIIQDVGVIDYLRENFPGLELHGSTQMAITSELGASYAKSLGVCRVVPARELSLTEMKAIKEGSGLEIECFIHGAMCYCYSGMCLFSSMLGDRSGNRGRCAQPCRLPLTPYIDGAATRECFPLSLKDMCTIEHIKALIEAGVDSFKIEGRMKSPEYVAGVTSIYRKYIDMVLDGKDFSIDPKDIKALDSLYIRSQRMDGYYFRRNGREMVTLDSPAYSGNDDKLIERLRREYVESDIKININAAASFLVGEPASLIYSCNGIDVEVKGDIVEESLNRPITRDDIIKQIGKLGDTVFLLDSNMKIDVSPNAFYRLKGINELRRQAVQKLEELILASYGYEPRLIDQKAFSDECIQAVSEREYTLPEYSYVISCNSLDQLKALVSLEDIAASRISYIYIDSDLCLALGRDSIIEKLTAGNVHLLIALPYILRDSDSEYLQRIYELYSEQGLYDGFLARNYQEYYWVSRNCPDACLHCDYYLYAFNHNAVKVLRRTADAITIPVELTAAEQHELLASIDTNGIIKMVYGNIPMMVTANCIMKTMKKCIHGTGKHNIWLNDRKNVDLNVEIQCNHCYNIIYNSLPLLLIDKKDKINDRIVRRIDFSNEGYAESVDILNLFLSGRSIGEIPAHTTGHEFRSVL